MKNISKEKVLSISVVMAPADEQVRFAGIVMRVEDQRRLQLKAVSDLDALFASRQHRAFRGEL